MSAEISDAPLAVPMPEDLPADLRQAWEQARGDTERGLALLRVSFHVGASSRWQALEFAQQALGHATRGDDPELVIKALLGVSWSLGELGRVSEALDGVNRALTLAASLGRAGEALLYDALSARAPLRSALGDDAGARRDYLTVIHPQHGARDPLTLLLAHLHLSALLVQAGQPEAALHHSHLASEHLSQALAAGSEEVRRHGGYYQVGVAEGHLRALVGQAEWLHGRARLGARDEVMAQAWAELGHALPLAQQQGERAVLLSLHCHAANLARLAGDLNRARAEAERAVQEQTALGRTVDAEAYITLGKVYLAQRDRAGATAAYEAALAIAGQSGQRQRQREVRRILSRLYEERGDLRAALHVTREALDAEQAAWSAATVLDLSAFDLSGGDLAGGDPAGTALPEGEPGEGPGWHDLSWQEQLRLAEQQARTDPLTGLLNRRGLREALAERQGHLASEVGAAAPSWAVAMLDIDDFKLINDQHSHRMGDAVLRTVAHLLRDALPPDALVARYGGEEFLVVLWASREQVRPLIERCREAVGAYDWGPLLEARRVTLSGGYALGTGDRFDDLIHEADEHLYRAKRGGRNRLSP